MSCVLINRASVVLLAVLVLILRMHRMHSRRRVGRRQRLLLGGGRRSGWDVRRYWDVVGMMIMQAVPSVWLIIWQSL